MRRVLILAALALPAMAQTYNTVTITPNAAASAVGQLRFAEKSNSPSRDHFIIEGPDTISGDVRYKFNGATTAGCLTLGAVSGGVNSITVDATCGGGSLWTLDSGNVYRSSGNVGIGISTGADERLTVNGAVLVEGTTTIDNTKVAGLYGIFGSSIGGLWAHDGGSGITLSTGTLDNGGASHAYTSYTESSGNGVILSQASSSYIVTAPSISLASGTGGVTLTRNAGSLPAAAVGPDLHVGGVDGGVPEITLDSFGTGNLVITGRSARGTAAAPSATQAGDTLLNVRGIGYGDTAYATSAKARMLFSAAANWSDTSQPTYISFTTTPVGSTTQVEAMRIDSTSNVLVGAGVTAQNRFQVHVAANKNIGVRDDGTTGYVGLGAFDDAGTSSIPMSLFASKFLFAGGAVGVGIDPIFPLHAAGAIFSDQGGGVGVLLGETAGSSGAGTSYGGIYYSTVSNSLVIEALSGGVAWRDVNLVASGGNVGVGMTGPRERLEVNGAALVSGTTTIDNTKVAGLYATYGSSSGALWAHDGGAGITMSVGTLDNGGSSHASLIFAESAGTGTALLTASTIALAGTVSVNVTGSTQCLHVNSSGVVSGTGADCATQYWTSSGGAVYNTGRVLAGMSTDNATEDLQVDAGLYVKNGVVVGAGIGAGLHAGYDGTSSAYVSVLGGGSGQSLTLSTINPSGATTSSISLGSGGFVLTTAAGAATFDSSAQLTSSGNVSAEGGKYYFAGYTSSYPMWKRSSTTIQARLADDSGYASAAVQDLTINGTCTGCGGYWTSTGGAIYNAGRVIAGRSTDDATYALQVGAGIRVFSGNAIGGGTAQGPGAHVEYASGTATVAAEGSGSGEAVQLLTVNPSGTTTSYMILASGGTIFSNSGGYAFIGGDAGFSAGVQVVDWLRFNGATSSEPAWKRSSTTIQARLADDSGYASVAVQNLTVNGSCTGCGSGAVSSVSGSGSGILVSPTTGAVVVSNTGVTAVAVSSPLAVTGSTGSVTFSCSDCMTTNTTQSISGSKNFGAAVAISGGGTPASGATNGLYHAYSSGNGYNIAHVTSGTVVNWLATDVAGSYTDYIEQISGSGTFISSTTGINLQANATSHALTPASTNTYTNGDSSHRWSDVYTTNLNVSGGVVSNGFSGVTTSLSCAPVNSIVLVIKAGIVTSASCT